MKLNYLMLICAMIAPLCAHETSPCADLELEPPMLSQKRIPKTIIGALHIIAKNLADQDINWVIITSCALALQGVDVDPDDIDIMTDDTGLLIINKVLDDYKTSLSDNTPSAIFASTKSKFCVEGCSVEAMSNFKIKSCLDDTWHAMNDLLNYRTMAECGGITIPVLPLTHLIKMYTLMGRDKDVSKIEKIKQHLRSLQIAS